MADRYRWWDFVCKIVLAYPKLKEKELLSPDDRKDRDAVAQAVASVAQHRDGAARLKLIEYVYWNEKRHRVGDAAPRLHIAEATAKRWHGDFIREVARNYGFCVNDTTDS